MSHYLSLPKAVKKLVVSYSMRGFAYPIFSIFVNAFIWRVSQSVWNISVYNLASFIGLPLGFFVNGFILKKIKIKQSYFLGLALSMLSVLAVIFFTGSHWSSFLLYGTIYGFGCGLYWSCRNYLSFQETKDGDRNYFLSLISSIELLAQVIISFLAGLLIMSGETSTWYTPIMAYWFLIFVTGLFTWLAGFTIKNVEYHSPVVTKIWQPFVSREWNTLRIVDFGIGLLEGIKFFLPTLLILYFLGKEGVLGTITAIVSLLTILFFYVYGRLAKPQHRKKVFLVSLVIHLILAGFLALVHNGFNVIVYVLLSNLPQAFFWLTLEPWMLARMDKEVGENPEQKYFLVFDMELFLNMGRIISVLGFLAITYYLGTELALQITPLILALIQIVVMALAWRKLNLQNGQI